MFMFSLKLEKWSFHVADLPRTGKKCSEIKKARDMKGAQSFCFGLLRTVPTNSMVFLPRLMIMQGMQIFTSVIEIQNKNWG